MGLLDYFDPDRLKAGLQGLLGKAPIVKALHGEKGRSFKQALLDMPIGDAEGAYEAALNIGPMMLGKIVYHGSPHKFEKFDASKIGTGEGAQAYGHGVYLADSEGVAARYKNELEGKVAINDLRRLQQSNVGDAPLNAAKELFNQGYSEGEITKILQQAYPDLQRDLAKVAIDAGRPGSLYKAGLPDEWIPKMLDWDKPLSQQPEVLKALETHPTMGKQSMGWRGAPEGQWERAMSSPTRTGEWLYREIANNAPKETVGALQQAGIPGIRYLDGGSRGAGQGTYNYVVFPGLEDQVKILERNGIPLTGLLGK